MANSGSLDIKNAWAALRAGDPESMKSIYALTAPRLYGKLKALMQDKTQARQVLHATYLSLWQNRANLHADEGREFEKIAALAHRCALADRFRTAGAKGLQNGEDAVELFERGSGEEVSLHMLDERDRAMLKAAYLEFESIEKLARQSDLPPGDTRQHLARLASGKGGQSNG